MDQETCQNTKEKRPHVMGRTSKTIITLLIACFAVAFFGVNELRHSYDKLILKAQSYHCDDLFIKDGTFPARVNHPKLFGLIDISYLAESEI